ncbi:hypothetical protein JTB14_034450, partial [Gonioctena quinquepunctata]
FIYQKNHGIRTGFGHTRQSRTIVIDHNHVSNLGRYSAPVADDGDPFSGLFIYPMYRLTEH